MDEDDLSVVIDGILNGIKAYYDDWESTYGIVKSTREDAHQSLLALWRVTHSEP